MSELTWIIERAAIVDYLRWQGEPLLADQITQGLHHRFGQFETLAVVVPVAVVSEKNKRECLPVRDGRRKKQRRDVGFMMLSTIPRISKSDLVGVRMVRLIGDRGKLFDTDNLQRSLSAVRDEIAAHFKMTDAPDGIPWFYDQRDAVAGEYGVEIEVFVRTRVRSDRVAPHGPSATNRRHGQRPAKRLPSP